MIKEEVTNTFLYLPAGSKELERYPVASPPEIQQNTLRIVCISDTHNEHEKLRLPWGHLLVHAGDILTESGIRHTKGQGFFRTGEEIPNKWGRHLADRFAAWLGTLPHPHKVVIPGNHDTVFELMGKARVVRALEKYNAPGSFAYLLHEHVALGQLKIFGSPIGEWGSHNNAFAGVPDYSVIEKGTDIVVTHYPAILPRANGKFREDEEIAAALNRAGAKIHVGGHSHWAHGVYWTKEGGIPAVVASSCASGWKNPFQVLFDFKTVRGDVEGDRWRGGYELVHEPIVCDVFLENGVPDDDMPFVFPEV